MCTDGVTEFRFGEEELGSEGLDVLFRHRPAVSRCKDRLNAVVEELQRAGWRSRDDLTLLAIDDSAWPRRSLEQRHAQNERTTRGNRATSCSASPSRPIRSG